jgi:Dyp-type peroxidase family
MALTEEDLQTVPENGIDPENPGKYAALLKDLQGNILRGHGRDSSVHLFLQFKPGQVQQLKKWIGQFADKITSAQKQAEEAKSYRDKKIAGDPFVNFFLTRKGYEYLGFKPFQIPGDESFRFGMKNDKIRNLLGDPVVEKWDPGLQEEIHALLLIADDNVVSLLQTVNKITRDLYRLVQVVHREDGFILKNEQGEHIEHFGFIDGISQPLFLTRDIERAKSKTFHQKWEESKWDSRAPLSLVLVKDPNGDCEDSYGSYLVCRKLEQDVKAFIDTEEYLADLAKDKSGLQLNGDVELGAALMMGRFRDGTPLTMKGSELRRTELPDDTKAGEFDDFNYDNDTQGLKCPFHTHVRKTNPRGDTGRVDSSGDTHEEALEKERNHRIARRAVSYGVDYQSLPDGKKWGQKGFKAPVTDSGLFFLCFQADIANQFNFMQSAWANANNFVQVNVGVDPIIGQTQPGDGQADKATGNRTQEYPIAWGSEKKQIIKDFNLWVHFKGGEYFFAPSISSLKKLKG